ncbi:hypothetical protein [Mycobacterium sp. Aquia_213]|uniref:hypothetical protein n=1 Tax=Mycobacterium sp. Aquia_213 TaxID=2991728 RepID=UPI00227059D1|nr:hypothetical protein [Mycobacterium sp. Aquia_213]WAC90220.1 hypothetical protein LMQ14_20135 [Mycobacterium sp. Aquia_213]
MTITLLSPANPPGDDPHEAKTVFNQVMQSTAALTEALAAIVCRHSDSAPVSSDYVQDLLAVLSTDILDWIWRWPS